MTIPVDFANQKTNFSATAEEIDAVADLSGNGARRYIKRVAIPSGVLASSAEQDTSYDLPTKCVVHGVYLDVTTAEATGTTKTVTVGTAAGESGDADGFLAGVSVAATGIVKGTLDSGGQTVGALLRVDESGAGVLVPEGCVSQGGKSLVITAGSNDFAELAGYILVDLTEIA